jgi:purine nucleosidase
MRLIIDTDTAGDDVFSLMLALTRPGVTVEAITIAHGNVGFVQHAENALATLEAAAGRRGSGLSGRSGAVQPRAARRGLCLRPRRHERQRFRPAAQRPADGHAVDEMVRRIMAAPGEITLIAQAPLTNIALAYLREPRIAKAVKHLWIMGGTDNGVGNVTPAAEYNFYVDPEAAKIVVNAGFNLSIATWTLTLRDGLWTRRNWRNWKRWAPIRPGSSPTSTAPPSPSPARPKGWTAACTLTPSPAPIALDESLILEAENCVVDVETMGELTRGYLSVSHAILPDIEIADPALKRRLPNARVIKKIDQAGFFTAMKNALL